MSPRDIIKVILLSTLLSHIISASAHPFNISHDLLLDTQNGDFLFDEWTCLDEFLTVWDENPRELESLFSRLWSKPHMSSITSSCRCFFNAQCSSSPSPVTALMWVRCYHLESEQALRNLTSALNSTTFLRNQTNNKVEACTGDTGHSTLRFELVHVPQTNVVHSAIGLMSQLAEHVHLESLTIRNSSLERLSLSSLVHLKSLNLTCNSLSTFDSAQLLPPESSHRLVSLDLSHNRLSSVNLSSLKSLTHLDLSFNNISTLHQSELSSEVINRLRTFKGHSSLPFKLHNNPWQCDGPLEWLVGAISGLVSGQAHLFRNVHGLELAQTDEPECWQPASVRLFPFSVWQSVRASAICGAGGCSCFLEPKYAQNGYRYVIVNCTSKGLASMPNELPKNAKVIDLTANHIRRLNVSGVKLSHWEHVNKIILANNSLETLDGLDQIHSNWTIVYLDISGNLLTEIPYHILDREKVLSSRIDKILIGHNPYSCDCNTVKMQKWLQSNYRIIHDLANVRCGFVRPQLLTTNDSTVLDWQGPLHHREILKINNLELCPSIASKDVFFFVNIALGGVIFLLIVKLTYDYFYQKRTGKLPRFWWINF